MTGVRVVIVDDHAEAVVAAAREAIVNAAKFGEGAAVSVFAEVRDDELEVFVRVRRLGRTSVTWEFEAWNAASGEHLATSSQTAVYVADRRPVRVDDGMRGAVAAFDTAVES